MYKKRFVSFWIVLTFLLIVSSPIILASEICSEDSDCAILGDTWACDTSISECVELDLESLTDEDIETEDNETVDTEAAAVDTSEDEATVEEEEEEEVTTETESTTTEDSDLDASVGDLDTRVTDIETNIETINSQIEDLTTTVDDINTNVQLLSTDQYQLERDIEEQVTEVSSGLAVLQEDIESTKSELEGTKEEVEASSARASFFRTLSIVIIIIGVFLAIAYFLRMHKKEESKELPEDIRSYITKQIKLGVSEIEIVAALKKSSWPEHDAKWAFEQTTVKNYNDFLKSQGKATKEIPKHKLSGSHYQKIAIVSILSIVLLAVMLFYIKQSVGFAVYYEGISSEDLSSLVEETLESSIDQNSFYSLIDYLDLCVQVNDQDASTSFRVLKTPYGNSITELEENCDVNSVDYDFAVSFSTWSEFYTLSNSMTCDAFENAHSVSSGSVAARGMYVLPSYYVEEGFTKVEGRSYTDFCDALSLCLSSSDLALLDIGC